jgi:hypothetical protein
MATYYTIQCWYFEDIVWESDNLYESLDDACDAMDEEIRKNPEYKPDPNYDITEEDFKENRVIYYESPDDYTFVIRAMKVVCKD